MTETSAVIPSTYMIRFLQPIELEVIESFDEATEKAETKCEVFSPDERVDAEVVCVNEEYATAEIQFGDGSVAYGVPTSAFKVVD